MNSYHFSVGDSTWGPVGFCAQVAAKTRCEALAKLRNALCGCTGSAGETVLRCPDEDVEYIAVYLNPERIRACDIDETVSGRRGSLE